MFFYSNIFLTGLFLKSLVYNSFELLRYQLHVTHTVSEKIHLASTLNFIPLFYFLFLNYGRIPFITRIKHPVINFRTRKNQVFGLKLPYIYKSNLLSLLSLFNVNYAFALKKGFSPSFSFANLKTLQLSQPKVFNIPLLKGTLLSTFMPTFGADLSLTTKQFNTLPAAALLMLDVDMNADETSPDQPEL